MKEYDCEVHDDVLGNFCNSQTRHSFYVYRSAFSFRFVFVLFTECLRKHKFLCLCWNFSGGFGNTVVFSQFQRYYCQCMLQSCDLEYKIFDNCTSCLSSPRAKRTGPKGLRAESARAVTGRRCLHSGRGEDFLSRQPNFSTETAVTPERKVEKSFPRWEINRHAEG